MLNSDPSRVIACIPYFRSNRYIRRAVESLLTQTHRNLTVVVVNDGDPDPPWDVLADIRDPRLIRYSLSANHGPYFAIAVVLNATSAPYFLMQDADDWSAPQRVNRLLDTLVHEQADLAVSAQPQHHENPDGSSNIVEVRWQYVHCREERAESAPFVLNRSLTPDLLYRAPHAGLFRVQALRNVGGYYGGFRIAYDTLLTNLILMTGKIAHIPDPLYYRLVRPTSLTNSAEMGIGSAARIRVQKQLAGLYSACFGHYRAFQLGQISSGRLTEAIRSICTTYVTAVDQQELRKETERFVFEHSLQLDRS